jgi:hypothetical protein
MLSTSDLSGLAALVEPDFEPIFPGARPGGEQEGFALASAGDLLLGVANRRSGSDLQQTSRELYRQLLRVTAGWQLYRIWNQIPAINALSPQGLEHYRAFSAGRSLAFEDHFGSGFTGQLPAASGVGTRSPDLTVAFAAGRTPPRHFENPEQVPAYRYPAEHGPRAPSFARASAAHCSGRPLVFVSGTAAIKGHRTVSPLVLPGQIQSTLDNLALIGAAAGLGRDLGAGPAWKRYFKIYYRQEADRPAIAAALERSLLHRRDHVIWRETDLCRADLLVEIEATLMAG